MSSKATCKLRHLSLFLPLCALLLGLASPSFAESQGDDYKGITDPFGDPANYEFAEDEREDKEFFHLGRFLMLGLQVGAGAFTGGLGATNSPAFVAGGEFVYFFDPSLSMEIVAYYANDLDAIPVSGGGSIDITTTLIPITGGIRYYIPVKEAPRAIALANPYLALGGGIYLRNQNPVNVPSGLTVTGGSTDSFGAYGGGGMEFNIYGKHFFMGIDVRYHLIFFPDADTTYNGQVAEGSRSGNWFNGCVSLTYSF